MNRKSNFLSGFKDGIPICLGYIAVSFTFGIMAGNQGLSVWEAVLISLTNVTSAGQFAGLGLIAASASYVEMIITQFIINLRYCLMSCALSQKFSQETPFFHRFFISYGVTDEIFAISVCREGKLHPFYSYGAISVSVFGWVFGTFLGIVSGNLLPVRVVSALSVALYGMFIAIIVPPAREYKNVLFAVALAIAASVACKYLPIIRNLSSGWTIILITIVVCLIAAWLFPVEESEGE